MNKKLYNKILNSIDNEIKTSLKEQFNINDIDFTGDAYDGDANIFNKYVIDP